MNPSTWRHLARAGQFLILLAVLASTSVITRADQGSAAPAAEPQPRVYLPLLTLGSGAAAPNDPVAVRFVDDAGRAAHAAIGPEGGTLSAAAADGTRFELVVPAEALDFSETITMTPVLRAENLPLSGGLIGAVNLEPAGLTFYQPAALRIIPAAHTPGFETIGFAYNGSGEQFHLRPLAPSAGIARLQSDELEVPMPPIVTLRPVGAGRGTRDDVVRQQEQSNPSDPLDALAEDTALAGKHEARLYTFYDKILFFDLLMAETEASMLDQALREFEGWLYLVETAGLTESFASEIAEAKTKLLTALRNGAAVSAERCYTQKRPEEGFRLLRWLRYARKYLPSADIAAIQARLPKCLRFELSFHSTITESSPGYGYYYELHTKTTLRAAQSTRATGSGSLDWVDFHWIGGGPCTFATQGESSTFDAASAGFGLSMAPVSRTSPAVKLALRYDPGVPYENTTMSCPASPPVSWHTHAWNIYFGEMHEYEREGSAIEAKVQVVNAGSFTGWVYHHTTTGPSGQDVVEDTRIELMHAPEP